MRLHVTVRPAAAALALAAALGAASCGDTAERGVARHPTYGGTVVVAAPTDLSPLNPLVTTEAWAYEFLQYVVGMTLVRYDPELGYAPYLATSWEMQGDTGVVFHLRRDVRWHDGEPTTANDVAFTFERAKDPATAFPNSEYFTYWRDVEVRDSFTVAFTFDRHAEPLAGWPFTAIAPKHLLDTVPPEAMRQAAYNRAPVGNGPFRFVSQRMNDRWVFEANPDFPEALGGRPYIDRLVWRVMPENTAQMAEVQSGELDLALNPVVDQVRMAAERPGISLVERPARRFLFVGWNGRRPPLDDPVVRRALSMAMDRRMMIEGLRDGFGRMAVGPVMPWHWAYDRSLEPLPLDPDSAVALLASRGIRDRDGDGVLDLPDGSPFSIQIDIPASSSFNRDLGELVRSNLAAIGVAATTRPVEGSTLIAAVVSPERRFDAFILAWDGDFRLNLRDLFHSAELDGPYQFAGYRNAEVDRILDEANRMPDRHRSLPHWRRLQRILRDEQPWTFLFYTPDVYLKRDRLRGTDMDIRGTFVNVQHWWVTDAGGGR